MDLHELLEKTVGGLGYELVDVEWANRGRLLRVFIDKPAGISVDDCVTVSNHLSRVFEVENVDYDRLEVSSPGLDRPLKKASDFDRFVGSDVHVRLRLPLAGGRRNFEGRLLGLQDGKVSLTVEGVEMSFDLGAIDKARLVPRFD